MGLLGVFGVLGLWGLFGVFGVLGLWGVWPRARQASGEDWWGPSPALTGVRGVTLCYCLQIGLRSLSLFSLYMRAPHSTIVCKLDYLKDNCQTIVIFVTLQ